MAADLGKVSILARREIEARLAAPLMEALTREMGAQRAREVLGEVVCSLARQAGQDLARALGGNSLVHLAQGLELWTQEDALDLLILSQSENELCYDVRRCRYAEMYQELGLGELGLVLSCQRDFAFIEGFNPEVILTRRGTILEGQSYCDFRYRLKGTQDQEGQDPGTCQDADHG
ncbi:MAG: L-2-amino-thiazoline-4-carboxylic acid hydrolase [Desulfarculus sp.]|nr:L-2-amino-thiazoline-4-carboxylic acid hydrolase [Desulfarculus sp.]